VTRGEPYFCSSGTLLFKCLNAFMGILNTQADHAKTIGLEKSSSTTTYAKDVRKIDQEGYKGLQRGLR